MKVLFMNFIVSQRVSKAKANLNPPNNKVGTSLVVQMVKNPPAMQETWVWFLGQEGSLEKELATRNSILALENFKDRGAWQATVHGVTNSQTWPRNEHFHYHFFNIKVRVRPANTDTVGKELPMTVIEIIKKRDQKNVYNHRGGIVTWQNWLISLSDEKVFED